MTRRGRRPRRAGASWALAALGACGAAGPGAQPVRPAPAPSVEPSCPAWAEEAGPRLARVEARLAELVDQARITNGLAPLRVEPRLTRVARRHAEHMARLRTMAHAPEGSSPEDRLRAVGVADWDAVGENIAVGRCVNYVAQTAGGRDRSVACHDPDSLALEVFRAWYASPGHRAVLLDAAFTHLGSGAAYEPQGEAVYVTHDFAHLVTCGYAGAACCPPPPGAAGGICQRPSRCHDGTCAPPASSGRRRD